MLGHNFIAPDTISYRNLYKILSGGAGGGDTLGLCVMSYICRYFLYLVNVSVASIFLFNRGVCSSCLFLDKVSAVARVLLFIGEMSVAPSFYIG
jgi:hypothetical protein